EGFFVLQRNELGKAMLVRVVVMLTKLLERFDPSGPLCLRGEFPSVPLFAITSQLVEFLAKAFEDIRQPFFPFRLPVGPLGGLESGFHHSGKRPEYGKSLWPHPLSPILPPFCASPDSVNRFRILKQFLFSGGCKSINASSFLPLRFDETLVFEL